MGVRVRSVLLGRHDVEAAASQLGWEDGRVFKRLLGEKRLRLAFVFRGRGGDGPLGRGTKEARGRNAVVKKEL